MPCSYNTTDYGSILGVRLKKLFFVNLLTPVCGSLTGPKRGLGALDRQSQRKQKTLKGNFMQLKGPFDLTFGLSFWHCIFSRFWHNFMSHRSFRRGKLEEYKNID